MTYKVEATITCSHCDKTVPGSVSDPERLPPGWFGLREQSAADTEDPWGRLWAEGFAYAPVDLCSPDCLVAWAARVNDRAAANKTTVR